MIRQAATLFIIVFFFTSCKQHNDNAGLNMLIEGLTNANKHAELSNNRLYVESEQKSTDPLFAAYSLKWFPKSQKIRKLSAEMIRDIDISKLPVLALNSSYFKSGDTMELTAGMGRFSGKDSPRITVDDNEIPLKRYGQTNHFLQAKGKPGTYSLKVKLEYTKADGTTEYVTKNLSYTILP